MCRSGRDGVVVSSPPMRRLLCWCFSSLCLLSLLACLGTAWLWWDGRAVLAQTPCAPLRPAIAAALRVLHNGVTLSVSRGGRVLPVGVRSLADPRDLCEAIPSASRYLILSSSNTYRQRRCLGAAYATWSADPLVNAGFARVQSVPGQPWAESALTSISGLDLRAMHAEVVTVLAIPPLLWLALRARRRLVPHRRRRLGRCLRCGYDLTGNTSGVCSECGLSIPAEGRVTA